MVPLNAECPISSMIITSEIRRINKIGWGGGGGGGGGGRETRNEYREE